MSVSIFRIGFVIDSRVPSLRGLFAGKCGFMDLLHGCSSDSPVGVMRFGWIADAVNRHEPDLRYELFMPGHRYDAVVFLKSMGSDSLALARRLKNSGVKIIFDANVDYLTPAEGTFYYEGMAPTDSQRRNALAMMQTADAVIADSEHIAEKCSALHNRAVWVPDNVKTSLVREAPLRPGKGRLTVLWSGASCKVFDLLRVATVLKDYARHIRLVLVTDDWTGVDRCFEPYRHEIKDLLDSLDHEIIPFRSVGQLLEVYAGGDVFISPRFLDNSYNRGHTEWKITLPMACGRFVLASPQRSYVTVYQRSEGKGLRICDEAEDWHRQIDALLSARIDMAEEGMQGRRTVENYYETKIIARQHAGLLRKILKMGGTNGSA